MDAEEMFMTCVGKLADFADGNVSLLLAVSPNAEDLAPNKRGGKLVSLVVTRKVFDKGLCPGATGLVVGHIEESAMRRTDGTPWLRLRASKLTVTRKGNVPLGEENVVFEL